MSNIIILVQADKGRTIVLVDNSVYVGKVNPNNTTNLTVLSQNYFKFDDNIYQPPKDTAMGSPISSIIAEIFLQRYENMFMKHLFEYKNIIYYSRYVDDIFIMYDNTITDPDNLTNSMNNIHKDIIFKPTPSTNNQINFLDLLIIRNESSIKIDIYGKPTTTDTTINFFLNHPIEHKLATYRYYLTRMNSLPMSTTRKQNNEISYNT